MQGSEKSVKSTGNDPFFSEYTSSDAVKKYTRETAGFGISYLLDHDYKDAYLSALEQLPTDTKRQGIRIMEFGCGGGMNLLHLTSMLGQQGVRVEKAIGTDFSPVLVKAAKGEAQRWLAEKDQGKVEFCVANNETLSDDLSNALGKSKTELNDSFHFILGRKHYPLLSSSR